MLVKQSPVYLAFKYTVYALLAVNVGYFFFEALGGAAYTYEDGIGLADLIVAYADPIDTAAWLVLLLLLELETFIIPDEMLEGPLYWGLLAISTLCYVTIVYSFYGYVGALEIPTGFELYVGPDPCERIGGEAAFLLGLDDYTPLSEENCGMLADGAYYNAALNMFAAPDKLRLLFSEVWLDIVNSGVWIIVVTVIQLEVYLESSKLFGTKFFFAYKTAKIFLYGILMVAAIIWASWGGLWDAWDAFLWLVAFFFIEMNVLNWQEEVAHERSAEEAA